MVISQLKAPFSCEGCVKTIKDRNYCDRPNIEYETYKVMNDYGVIKDVELCGELK